MIHLFVIADDFTGALDTGVQFASYGAATKVVVGTGLQALEADAQTQVLVVDAETRHLPAAQAYDTVYRLVRWAKEKKIGCIYKKTDSALRGNIGAELSAALAADGGERLHFVPAFPNLDRVTRGGVHYIGGVPVAQSVFGKDPFEPVTHSRVEDILHEQTDTLCAYIPGGGSAEGKAGVLVYEAQTNRDMAQIADRLAARSETGLLAGCAGFASVLPRLLQLSCRDTAPLPLCGRQLAVCGSINPVSLEQCAQAEAQGAPASASRRSRSSRGTGRPARRRAKCWELCYGPVRRSRWWCWTQAARWRTRARTKPQTASRSPIRWARCSSVCWTTGWRARC